jgi:hypothetical protein
MDKLNDMVSRLDSLCDEINDWYELHSDLDDEFYSYDRYVELDGVIEQMFCVAYNLKKVVGKFKRRAC